MTRQVEDGFPGAKGEGDGEEEGGTRQAQEQLGHRDVLRTTRAER